MFYLFLFSTHGKLLGLVANVGKVEERGAGLAEKNEPHRGRGFSSLEEGGHLTVEPF